MSILILPPGITCDLSGLADTAENHDLKDRKAFYKDAAAPRTDKHGGYYALNGVVVGQTIQCCHCPKHFVERKGSGMVRHFCSHCHRKTCGSYGCQPQFCMTWEQKMDLIEAAAMKRAIVDSYLKIE